MQKISIIVPIYNVEKYLRKCLDSIINQTYKNIEIILINDGSPDNSLNICKEYQAKDERIIIIDKQNGGLSDARNAGLDTMTGEYVTFIDSDDWITEDYCETLYNNLKKYDADISGCNNIRAEDDYTVIKNNDSINEVEYNNIEAISAFQDTGQVMSCAKLYKNSMFDNLRFKKGKINEDEFIFHRIFYNCNKYVYTNKIMYYYRKTEGSIIRSPFSVKKLDIIAAYEDRLMFVKEKGLKKLYKKTEQLYIYTLRKMLAYVNTSNLDNKNEIQTKLYDKLIKAYKNMRINKNISIKSFIVGKLAAMFPSMFKKIIINSSLKMIK